MATISITTAQNIELDYSLGSIGERLVAAIIDMAILIGYIIILNFIFAFTNASQRLAEWALFLFYFPVIFYSLYSEILFNGQTAGKRSMSIKVVSLNGEQAGFGQYLTRWLFRLADIWVFGFTLGIIMMAVTERSQRLGDLVAGTVIVKTKAKVQLYQTLYMPVAETAYIASYPQVTLLKDNDIQLIKEILISVQKTRNQALAFQAMEKIEGIIHAKSRHEPVTFLYTLLSDYNHLASTL